MNEVTLNAAIHVAVYFQEEINYCLHSSSSHLIEETHTHTHTQLHYSVIHHDRVWHSRPVSVACFVHVCVRTSLSSSNGSNVGQVYKGAFSWHDTLRKSVSFIVLFYFGGGGGTFYRVNLVQKQSGTLWMCHLESRLELCRPLGCKKKPYLPVDKVRIIERLTNDVQNQLWLCFFKKKTMLPENSAI